MSSFAPAPCKVKDKQTGADVRTFPRGADRKLDHRLDPAKAVKVSSTGDERRSA